MGALAGNLHARRGADSARREGPAGLWLSGIQTRQGNQPAGPANPLRWLTRRIELLPRHWEEAKPCGSPGEQSRPPDLFAGVSAFPTQRSFVRGIAATGVCVANPALGSSPGAPKAVCLHGYIPDQNTPRLNWGSQEGAWLCASGGTAKVGSSTAVPLFPVHWGPGLMLPAGSLRACESWRRSLVSSVRKPGLQPVKPPARGRARFWCVSTVIPWSTCTCSFARAAAHWHVLSRARLMPSASCPRHNLCRWGPCTPASLGCIALQGSPARAATAYVFVHTIRRGEARDGL